MAMVEMQMALSSAVSMRVALAGRDGWECFKRQFIHRRLGLVYICTFHYVSPPRLCCIS